MDMRFRDTRGIGRPFRVLVADDDPDTVASLDLILTALGYDVRRAHDGAAAVGQALAVRPDAALLDLGMPEVDGCTVARWVRAQPWGRAALLVAVTGWGRPEDYARTRAAGFDHHLLKPADPERLTDLLAAWQAGARQRVGG